MRQLLWMAEGRAKLEWDQTAIVWAAIANQFRGKESQPAHPADVHPLRSRWDYEPEWDKDSHRDSLLMMLPQDQRAKVLKKLNGKA